MPDPATTAAAIAEPRAGDVWVSKRMVRMVLQAGNIAHWIATAGDNGNEVVTVKDFRRWARTAKLVHRGKHAE